MLRYLLSDQVAETRDACDRKEDLRALLFFYKPYYGETIVMSRKTKPIKPFLTYDQQIEHLKNVKKLIITDDASARKSLHNISYYALVGGYKSLFYDPMTRTYLPGTTFDDLLTLYEFDESLRTQVFEYSNIIEQKLRSAISYAFCENYGNLQDDYLNPSHYRNTRMSRYSIGKLVNILEHIVTKDTDHEYIVYQRNAYGNVPLYAASKVMTFGQLSAMYSLLMHRIQILVSQEFSTETTTMTDIELMMYLRVLTHFRNRCAHIERLFSYKDRYDIPDTSLHEKLKIPLKGKQYIYGKHDLFAIVIAYKYLLPKENFIVFKRSLANLIHQTVIKASTLTEKKLLDSMGFPENWKNITRYKI